MGHNDAALGHHGDQIAVAEPANSAVPAANHGSIVSSGLRKWLI
jgi:hypothetical protein